MASTAEFREAEALLKRLTWKQWVKLLDEMAADPDVQGVRRWLAGGADATESGAGAVLSAKEAGEVLSVERQRLWRWEKAGRIRRVATTNNGAMFLRVDVDALGREEQERVGARRTRSEDPGTALVE